MADEAEVVAPQAEEEQQQTEAVEQLDADPISENGTKRVRDEDGDNGEDEEPIKKKASFTAPEDVAAEDAAEGASAEAAAADDPPAPALGEEGAPGDEVVAEPIAADPPAPGEEPVAATDGTDAAGDPSASAAAAAAGEEEVTAAATAAAVAAAAASAAAAAATASAAVHALGVDLVNTTTETLPDGSFAEHFFCPKNLVGKLIGRQGATVNQIQDMSGAHIDVHHDTPGDLKRVTMKGTVDAVARCKDAVRTTFASDAPAASQGEVTKSLSCPQSIVGRIIGRGGETIRSLQAASGAHILVDQNFPDGVDRQISVTGRADGVDRALVMIQELMKGEPGTASGIIAKVVETYGMGVTLSMPINRAVVGRIIGKGGETIKGLQRKYSVSIQINQGADPMAVTITGPQQQAGACQAEIQHIIETDMPFGGPSPMGGFGGPRMGGGFGGGFGGDPYGGGRPPYGGFGGYGAPAAAYGGYGAPAAAYGGYGAPGAAYGGYGAPAAYGGAGYGAAGYGAAGYGAGAPAGAGSVWTEQQDDQGRTYYYNTQTGVSQWEKPADM